MDPQHDQSDSPSDLRLEIAVEPDADAAELDAATAQLRDELLELDVDDVDRPPGEPPPPGTRAVESALLGTLVVGLGRETIGALVRTIEGWLNRRSSGTVKLTIGGDSIELSNASDDDQRRLVESFVSRHASP